MSSDTTTVAGHFHLRDATEEDRSGMDAFFGAGRSNEAYVNSGMYLLANSFDFDQMLEIAQQQPDQLKLWLSIDETGEPIGLHLFHGMGFPGVWTYSVITSSHIPERRGAGTAIIDDALARFFACEGVDRLMGFISATAHGSRKAFLRNGAVIEGTARQHIPMPDGTRVDATIVAIVPGDRPDFTPGLKEATSRLSSGNDAS